MMNKNRTYCVKVYDTLEEIHEKLSKRDWTGCTGMQFEDILFLSDDGGEYGVVIEAAGVLTQVESFTVPWMTVEKFIEAALKVREEFRNGESTPMRNRLTSTIDAWDQHGTCRHCA